MLQQLLPPPPLPSRFPSALCRCPGRHLLHLLHLPPISVPLRGRQGSATTQGSGTTQGSATTPCHSGLGAHGSHSEDATTPPQSQPRGARRDSGSLCSPSLPLKGERSPGIAAQPLPAALMSWARLEPWSLCLEEEEDKSSFPGTDPSQGLFLQC